MRSKFLIAAAMLLAVGLVPGAARAAPSDLDGSFGTGGTRLVSTILAYLGEEGTGMTGLRELPDGRLVVHGYQRDCMDCSLRAVARYTPAGDPDPTFGPPSSPGAATFPGFDGYEGSRSTGLAIRRDGGLLLGYDGGPLGTRLVSVPANGTSPQTVTPLSEPLEPVAFLPDGRALARSGDRVVLLRADLTPDPAFGGGAGMPIPPLVGTVVGLTATGKALLVGGADRTGLTLWRVPLGGGSAVLTRIPFPRPPTGGPLALGAGRGRLVVGAGGRAMVAVPVVSRAPDESLVRRTVLGAFDQTGRVERRFGVRGALLLSNQNENTTIAVQRNGRVVVVSSPYRMAVGARPRLLVRRFDAAGRPDPSFRPRRLATVARDFYGLDVVVDGRGRIVIAGGAFTTFGHSGVLFVRLQGGEAPPRR